jgi:hypothetical protein
MIVPVMRLSTTVTFFKCVKEAETVARFMYKSLMSNVLVAKSWIHDENANKVLSEHMKEDRGLVISLEAVYPVCGGGVCVVCGGVLVLLFLLFFHFFLPRFTRSNTPTEP